MWSCSRAHHLLHRFIEGRRHQQLVMQAAQRLLRPHLSACFSEWRHEWALEMRRVAEEADAAKWSELAKLEVSVKAEMQAAKEKTRQLKQELGEAKSAEEAGAAQRAEAEALKVAQQEEERERRVAHLQGVAARRIGQLALSRGWSAWLEANEQHQRRVRLLSQAAGRLQRPKLTASFVGWRKDWEDEVRKAAEAARLQLIEDQLVLRRKAGSFPHCSLHTAPCARKSVSLLPLIAPSTSSL